jgi:SAM-dependent methyltransferase
MPQLARRNAILSLEQWETYYRGGALSTCPTAPDGGYDREVRDAWVEFFSPLRDGAHVLDIGTGNGVVALIAADTAAAGGRTFQIHGTDLARIDPVKHVADGARRFAGIAFHPGVATEELPFDPASFDAVSGHYALEYSEPVAALAAIHRVLKPGGVAQFVLHHAQSALIRSAHLSMREANWLFSEAKLYRKLQKVVVMEQSTGRLSQPAAIAANELRATIQALKQSIEPARRTGGGRVLAVALDAAQKLLTLRQHTAPQSAGIEVDRAEQDMRASVRRLNDLVGHARSDDDMARLEALATAAGFEVVERVPQLHAGNNLVGWRLRLRKP